MTFIDEIRENFHVDNYYQVLGIPTNSGLYEIKKAYLQKSLELHPDKVTDQSKKEESKKKFQIISAIYKILSNNESRDTYDQQFTFSSENNFGPVVSEEIRLIDCTKKDGFYSYDCRCSGRFVLDESYVAKLLETTNSLEGESNVFIVDCDTCSCSIKITS